MRGKWRSIMSRAQDEIDWIQTVREIVAFTKSVAADARGDGIVVGLSGGVDSTLP